ncbi:MAG: hypothetical protein DCF17_13780 [Shackletoniella antarctica]|uniref:Uncharacterized protein n=1 Tax=Shackletoniella antarctica TaxID=268115 RepID=A0A2W4XUC9_9CYAN|nr:MAG: hypothetical protein DCF17_13780 [Shackletoniella antarctica]
MVKRKQRKHDEIYIAVEQEFLDYLNRRSRRLFLQDFCRPELMDVARDWAIANQVNPRQLCPQAHDQINLKIQGMTAKEIRRLLGIGDRELIRDFFDTDVLTWYSLINVAAISLIERGLDPIAAVDKACETCLPPSYVPCPAVKQTSIRLQGLDIANRVNKRKQKVVEVQLELSWNKEAS